MKAATFILEIRNQDKCLEKRVLTFGAIAPRKWSDRSGDQNRKTTLKTILLPIEYLDIPRFSFP